MTTLLTVRKVSGTFEGALFVEGRIQRVGVSLSLADLYNTLAQPFLDLPREDGDEIVITTTINPAAKK